MTSDGRALPLVRSRLRVVAQGGIARATLEQTFANKFRETLHVTYRMPLPADGAVSGYAFSIGDRTIAGIVDKKAAAREKFERAIASGHTAGLLEQERDDIFTQRLGNIPAGEALVALISVDQKLAWLPEGEWEFRFPTVIGPRYVSEVADTAADLAATAVDTRLDSASVPDQAANSRPTDPQGGRERFPTSGIAARVQIELAIGDAIADGRKPASPTHPIAIGDNGHIVLKDAAKLDRDIVVRWPVAARACGLALATARLAGADDAFGLVTIVPPAPAAGVTPVARDLLILLDTSGSMGGAPLDKAKQVLPLLVGTLGEGDRLELIEFGDRPNRWKASPVAATESEKAEAIKWIRSRQASGGTEMRAAVIEALSTLRIGTQRQVVLVTDGYVGGEQQILAVLHERLPRSCRLHVVGVGAAVNRSLACALARAGRGAEIIVGPDEDAERGTKRLLDRTRRPMLTNVEIHGTALVRHAPRAIPDVFAGAPLVAGVQVAATGGELVVRGEIAGGEAWEWRVTVPARAAGEGDPSIVALYGREHVADLEANPYGGHDREIEETGVKFQLATRFTSWVAIDASRVVEAGPARVENVPQELPYGTSAQAFGLRAASAAVVRGVNAAMRTQSGVLSAEELELSRMLAAKLTPRAVDDEAAPEDTEVGATEQQSMARRKRATTGAAAAKRDEAPPPKSASMKTHAFVLEPPSMPGSPAEKEARDGSARAGKIAGPSSTGPYAPKTVSLSVGGGTGGAPMKITPGSAGGEREVSGTAIGGGDAPAPAAGVIVDIDPASAYLPRGKQAQTRAWRRIAMVLALIAAIVALLLWWLLS